MTFRITSFSDKNTTTIRVEGRLTTQGVKDLTKTIQGAAASVHLDLSNLQLADDEGVRALQSYFAQGMKLTGASTYIRQLLAQTPFSWKKPSSDSR